MIFDRCCKSGMINFTKSAAMELAPHGIRVNTLTPTASVPAEPDMAERFDRAMARVAEAGVMDFAGLQPVGTVADSHRLRSAARVPRLRSSRHDDRYRPSSILTRTIFRSGSPIWLPVRGGNAHRHSHRRDLPCLWRSTRPAPEPPHRIGARCGTFGWAHPRLRYMAARDESSAARIDELVRSLWVDTLLFDPLLFDVLVQRFGPDHIMYGTDPPFLAIAP